MRLFANEEDRPVRWDTVFSVDYGPDVAELGSIVAREQGAPTFPVSFAIDNDGSVWILDAVKHRIAHYSAQGRFAGSLEGGLRLDPHHPYPMVMAIIGPSVYVLLEETLRQWILVLSRDGVESRPSHRRFGPCSSLSCISCCTVWSGWSSAPPTT